MNTIKSKKKTRSNKLVWSSRAGYKKAVDACKTKKKKCHLFLDENKWVKAGIKNNTYIEECNVEEVSVRLGDFIKQKSYRCNCIEKRKNLNIGEAKVDGFFLFSMQLHL